MQKIDDYLYHRLFRTPQIKWIVLLIIILLFSACVNDHPKFTHFKAFDERFNTVIDTKNTNQLAALSELFYDRREISDVTANLDFQYLIDITTAEGSERWRCTKNGYCQLRLEGTEPQTEMYYIERYKELFALSNLN